MQSPIGQIRDRLQLTQAQFAAAAGVSNGHMSEVGTGVASLSHKVREFLAELFIDVETVEKRHNTYMKFEQRNMEARRPVLVRSCDQLRWSCQLSTTEATESQLQ